MSAAPTSMPPTVRVPVTVSVCAVVLSGRSSVGGLEHEASCTTLSGAAIVWMVLGVKSCIV